MEDCSKGGLLVLLSLLWPASLMPQTAGLQRNEVFVGARVGAQIPVGVSTPFTAGSTFHVRHKGVEIGYARELKNGSSLSVELFAYVSQYGYSGELKSCPSELDFTFPYTDRGVRKGVAVYDPLIITVNYMWRYPSGRHNEWRLSAGVGAMPFYSRSVSFSFSSSTTDWVCSQELSAQIGYGEDIYPIAQGAAAYRLAICGNQGLEFRLACVSTLFNYYAGYVAVDLLQADQRFTPWERRFFGVSLAARYDLAW